VCVRVGLIISVVSPSVGSRLVWGVGPERRVIFGAAHGAAAGGASTVAKVLLAKGREAPLLGDGIDVGADDKRHEVEEGQPGVLGEELLRKGKAERRRDPADAHHLPEADADRGAHLVERPGAGDDGHGDEVHRILDGRDLGGG